MSPERKVFLNNKLEEYRLMKIENKVQLCSIINTCIFLYQANKLRLKAYKDKFKKMRK